MRFSASTFARFAALSTLSAQLLASPVASIESQDNVLTRRGFTFPKGPKDPDPVEGPSGPVGRPPPGAPGATNPGRGGSDLGPSEGKTPDEIQAAGVTVQELLHGAISTNKADRSGVSSVFDANSKYKVNPSGPVEVSGSYLGKTLDAPEGSAIKFSDLDTIKYTNYKTYLGAEVEDREILIAQVSKDEGILHNSRRNNEFDTLDKDDPSKIFVSDQMYQVWSKAPSSKGLGPDNLKVVTGLEIKNDETQKMLKAAFQKANVEPKAPNSITFKPGSAEFDQMMGSDNGRPLGRMLSDYHNALGNLEVKEIRATYLGVGFPSLSFWLGKAV